MTLPVALDTNLLVRLLTNDDPQQARRVADLIDASSACFVPITVVLVLVLVLESAPINSPGRRLAGAWISLVPCICCAVRAAPPW